MVVALIDRRIREIGLDLYRIVGRQPVDEALARAIALDRALRPLLRQHAIRSVLPRMAWAPQAGPSAAWRARIRDAIDRVEFGARFPAGPGHPSEYQDDRVWEQRVELALTGSLLSEREPPADGKARRPSVRPPIAFAGARRGRQLGALGRVRTERLGDLRARYLELPPAEQDALANERGHCRPWLREHADRHGVKKSVAYADWKQLRTDLLAQGLLPVLNRLGDAFLAGDESAVRREKHRLRGLEQPQ